MQRVAILIFSLGVLTTPCHAQAQKPVEFNGMVFDSPPAQGYEAPAATTTTPKSRTSTHQQHHPRHHRTHSAS